MLMVYVPVFDQVIPLGVNTYFDLYTSRQDALSDEEGRRKKAG
jgi:hypothetical protein